MLLSARGFQKNTQSSLRYAHVHRYTYSTYQLVVYRHNNKYTQVGLGSVVCQFVVPLVPSQEAHRQASSHAKIGTGPANPPPPSLTTLWLQALQYQGCMCVWVHECVFGFTFLHFHRPQETNAEELGACERHCSLFHTCKMDHCLLQISVWGYLPYVTIPFPLFSHMNAVEKVDFFLPVHGDGPARKEYWAVKKKWHARRRLSHFCHMLPQGWILEII